MPKYNAKELRKTPPKDGELSEIKRNPIYFVLDRVLDTYNIGSLFRLADATAVEKIYICGDSEYPPSSKIHKSAVGTEEWVPWEKRDSALEVVKELKTQGVQIMVIEQSPNSIPYTLMAAKTQFPCAIVVGHETDGVCQEVLNEADVIVELPMFGVNKSFNVWGTTAVATYKLIEALILKPYLPKRNRQ